MLPILSLIVVLIISLVVVRVATVALTLTGLSRDLARFQARSAFTGAGFTTGESEQVVGHPVRRKIIMILMLLGNAGFVTVISTMVISFTNKDDSTSWTDPLWVKLSLLFGGLFFLVMFARSRYIERWMFRVIAWAIRKWTRLDARDYANLLRLEGDYAVSELKVYQNNWLADKLLSELKLSLEGVLVLGITRVNGDFIGAPRGKTRIESGDTILVYGAEQRIADLDQRLRGKDGESRHEDAVEEQQHHLEDLDREEHDSRR